ncbi:15028_t:CDS:2, partial [Funneliformis geosporum]
MPKVQRSSYSASEKLEILQYAKDHGQRAAARNFTIDHSMISRWEKQEEKLRSAKGKNRRVGAGRKAQYPEAEVSLKTWLIEFRKDGIAVTPKMVKTHMKEILINQFAHIYPNCENFLASERWFYGFLKRSGYSLRHGTKLPPIVIFKGKQIPKNLPSEIIVLMHPKGWMDESGMKTWFNKVWKKRPGGSSINKRKSLLVMDSFE